MLAKNLVMNKHLKYVKTALQQNTSALLHRKLTSQENGNLLEILFLKNLCSYLVEPKIEFWYGW